jgi:integrase
LLAEYTERHALTLRSPKTAQHHAYRLGPWLRTYRASDTRAVVARIKADMTGHYAPATINRSLGTLRKALRIAWEFGRVSVDYSSLVHALPENNARTTWLDMAQVRHLADHASEEGRAAIWISLLTGCRRLEVCTIRAEDIGPDVIRLQAGNTKTLRHREVPIIPPLRPWLPHLPLKIGPEGVKSAFRRAREAAGMPHVQFRDLRRSCGTLLIQAGEPLHVVSRILGHASVQVTERVYAHLAPRQLHASLDALTALHQAAHQTEEEAGPAALSA